MEIKVEVEDDWKSRAKKNWKVLALASLLLLSLAFNAWIYLYYENKYSPKFNYVSPDIAWLELGDFLEVQGKYNVEFQSLRAELENILNGTDVNGFYGVYFEDLNTGAWLGINERERFVSASLLKVPIMVAALKKVEKGELKLDQKITLEAEDLNSVSGTLASKGAGYQISLKELLVYLIKESDNTAVRVFHRAFLTTEDVIEARLAMGLPVDGENIVSMGPKQYSNILRSLYYSAYLRRTFSEMALSIMSETDYNSQIPAGVPRDVPVSHKIGFVYGDHNTISYHDCGIIYHRVKPYLLCVMSRGANQGEADRVIAKLSKATYTHVDKISG